MEGGNTFPHTTRGTRVARRGNRTAKSQNDGQHGARPSLTCARGGPSPNQRSLRTFAPRLLLFCPCLRLCLSVSLSLLPPPPSPSSSSSCSLVTAKVRSPPPPAPPPPPPPPRPQQPPHARRIPPHPCACHEKEAVMEWEKQEHHHHHHHQHHQQQQQQQPPQQAKEAQQQQQGGGEGIGNGAAGGNGMLYVKVMTDEQLETLRKQIAVYASICEQLVEMHKNLTAQQDLAGVRLGNLYCDPLMTTAGHKITARQRWTPTPIQLQILERIFNEGNGTPSKQKIKEITTELSQHGQISETNVYNWFQNRRARSKRKLQNTAGNNTESEAEAEVESPKEMKTKPEIFQSQQNPVSRNEDMCFQGSEISSDLHFTDSQTKVESMFSSDGSLRSRSRNLGQLSFYDAMLSNAGTYSDIHLIIKGSHPGNEHLGGKMEVPGAYGLYHHSEDFGMSG